jgi:hypothetical protein
MQKSFISRLGGVDVSGRKTYDLVDEPIGDEYRALLLCARSQCDTAVLSVDLARPLDPGGEEVVGQLAGTLRSDTVSGRIRWLRYGLSQDCLDRLGEAPSLYAWRQPGRPENLCLLRPDGSPWIISIAAEAIGYVELTPFEKLLLGRSAPGLAAVLAHQGAQDAVLAAFERRLEDETERLQEGLLRHAQSMGDDGRDGLVGALREWLLSGEVTRMTAAVFVVAHLGLLELEQDLTHLAEALRRGLVPAPAVFRANQVLRVRWRIRFDRQLAAAVATLEAARTG